ncbi:MAG TPA: Rieske 2Fe-2S domain-containing protein [Gemmatimonadota bacterium]|nr:Rieske 2Fe-2S domain-containing protein [Gemmatimonadota bacterium]
MRTLAASAGLVAAIAALLGILIFAIAFFVVSLRSYQRQQEALAASQARAAGLPPPATRAPAVSRRDFFRRSLISSLLVFSAQFGGASIAFLWPSLKGGFGALIDAGDLAEIKSSVSSGEPFYVGTGRFYIVPYNGTPKGDVDYVSQGVAGEGIMPLYQRCVHLGCRVPFCGDSKWFECPCHGSKYNQAGEYQLGPAPRGMDRFHIEVVGGRVMVDTSEVVLGPARGTDTIDQPPQGAFCVAPG